MEPAIAGTADADLCSRIRELQETLSADTIALEISRRNALVAALPNRRDRLSAGSKLILDQPGTDMADLPGGASGMLCRDFKGEGGGAAHHADRSWAVVSLLAELRQMSQALNRLRAMVSLPKCDLNH